MGDTSTPSGLFRWGSGQQYSAKKKTIYSKSGLEQNKGLGCRTSSSDPYPTERTLVVTRLWEGRPQTSCTYHELTRTSNVLISLWSTKILSDMGALAMGSTQPGLCSFW